MIAVLVQHHPSRAHLLPPLLKGLAPLPVEVVIDPEPDGWPRSPWRTYEACLEAFSDDASHALVLQDDALLCRDFSAALPNVIRTAQERSGGDPVIVLMTWGHGEQRHYPVWARAKHNAHAGPGQILALPVTKALVPVVGVVWPRSARDAFLAFIKESAFVDPSMDDWNVGLWARECAAHVVGTAPNLVQHRTDVDRVHPWSQPGVDSPEHRAACYIGERSALDAFPNLL